MKKYVSASVQPSGGLPGSVCLAGHCRQEMKTCPDPEHFGKKTSVLHILQSAHGNMCTETYAAKDQTFKR